MARLLKRVTKERRAKKEVCDLNCPKCHELWGKMSFAYEGPVRASDVTVVAGKKRKFKDGEDLACTLCGHTYTNWDVILAIAAHGKGDNAAKI